MRGYIKALGAILGISIIGLTGGRAVAGETTFPRFTQAEGRQDSDGLPLSGVKLCVLPDRAPCFVMPAAPVPNSPKELYQFGLMPRSERLPIASGGAWVFFSGMFSGGGSSMLERVAILRYGANGKFENLMPEVTQTEMADRAMWNVPDVSPYPLFVRADFEWADNESHFDKHLFVVDAWAFDPATGRYAKRFSYRTTRRYDRGEGSDHVLSAERAEIMRRLAASK
ncbi:hypothetical protein GQ57_34610 [Burkholderia sp. MSh2]|uniref:Uncharacterized protein n=1 Tax=Burkholderia paludis TaxID=1506587 RepID=A0A6J5EQ37_9BURK|nr:MULTISPECIES: hypothetical protein [Burkholderia]KEZ01532.1 hypothetical protein GQ57_34610 [Burkholderia sp. MSh2]CAB3768698.1 hypothetical protein LMG30113_05791 [Burkholderia paludis]VWC33362.1 hypothetical protein BPA30113_06426 [Burkholderia paludis]